jgi:PAS domain S-box-containing protein
MKGSSLHMTKHNEINGDLSMDVYKRIIENMKEAVVFVSGGNIQYANASFKSMFGNNSTDLQGIDIGDLILIHTAPADKVSNSYYGIGITLEGKRFDLEFDIIEGKEKDNRIYILRDISEMKVLSHQLLQERNLNSAIINTLPTFLVMINTDGTIRYMNYYMQNMIGKSMQELQYLNYVDNFVYAEDRQSVGELFKEIQNKKISHYISQNKILCKDGMIRLVEWYSCSVLNAEEEVECFFGIGIDITEKNYIMKELFHQLTEAEILSHNLKAVFDNSQDMIWSVDPEFRMQIYNKTLKDFIYNNYGTIVCVNAKLEDIMPEIGVISWTNMYLKAIKDGAFYTDYRTIKGNRYLKLYITPIYKNNNLISISVYANDVTELILIEIELKKNEYRLKEAQRISKTGHWEYDLITHEFKLSDEMMRMIEWEDANVTFSALLKVIHPEDRNFVRKVHDEFIRTKETGTFECKLLLESGKIIYIRHNYFYQIDDNQLPICYLGTLQDISEQKLIEDEILQLNKVLEDKVQERTLELIRVNSQLEELNAGLEEEIQERIKLERELNEARDAAERSSQYKSEFLANMSHEIRTPLNAVIGFYHLLKNTSLSVKQLDYLIKSEISAQNLLNTIDDILDFSKIEANRIELEYTHFDIRKILHNIESIMKPKAFEKVIDLSISVDDRIPSILVGDPNRINQIVLNLANNAVKFTHNGGVHISLILVSKTLKKVHIRIAVKDTGIGMSQEQIDKIFNPFSQGDTTITRKYGGTGLGLSICKSLAYLMGGEISASSELGNGSVFYFEAEFDYEDRDQYEETVVQESQLKIQFVNTRALLVEDNKINQQVSYEMMNQAGIEVDTAEDGMEALKMLEAGNVYDIILMDLHMPVLNGYDTSMRIRCFDQRTPIIAMSADIVKGVSKQVWKAGMNEYISKPFNPVNMLMLIKSMIGKDKTIEVLDEIATTADHNLELRTEMHIKNTTLPDVLPGLEIAEALVRINGKPEIYCKLLQFFLADHANFISDLRTAIHNNDLDLSIRLTHTLKGSSANIGAVGVSVLAERIQHGLENQKYDYDIDKDALLIIEELEVVRKSIRTLLLNDFNTSHNKETVNPQLQIELMRLGELIKLNDFDSIEVFERIRNDLEKAFDSTIVNDLQKLLVQFQWSKAYNIISKLY